MTIPILLEAQASLVFSQVVKEHLDGTTHWIIAHVIDVDTLEPVVPQQSIFINKNTLARKYQFLRMGPFFTPYEFDLTSLEPPKEGDILVGLLGSNARGDIYTSWTPHKWAHPLLYFFYYLRNSSQAIHLYKSREETLQMVLLSRLTVHYGTIPDERLYDLLVLILFDDIEGLLTMCRKTAFRPMGSRIWDLTNQSFRKKLLAKQIVVPTVAEFVEEAAYLIGDSDICGHFRAVLAEHVSQEKNTFQTCVKQWIRDKNCLNVEILQHLLDNP